MKTNHAINLIGPEPRVGTECGIEAQHGTKS
jgi:hypothetical protein